MDQKELYNELISASTLSKMFDDYHKECNKKGKELDELCWEQIHLFLKLLDFKPIPGIFDEWQRARKDGVTETVELGMNYVGIFLKGKYTSDELHDIRDYFSENGETTISANGIGAFKSDIICERIFSLLWQYYSNEFSLLEEKLGV